MINKILLSSIATLFIFVATGYAQTPLAPSNLAVNRVSKTSVQLTWLDNSGNEDEFVLERSLNGTTWTNPVSLSPNTTAYLVNNLDSRKLYQFRLRAVNASGNSVFVSGSVVTTEVCLYGQLGCNGDLTAPASGGANTTMYYPTGQIVSSRCPNYPTPAFNAPLRTRYVSATASGSGDGLTPASPWTIQQANSNAQAGDKFFLRGTFQNRNLNPAQSGTAANKVVYEREPGQIAKFIPPGVDESYLSFTGKSHLIVKGIEFEGESYPLYHNDTNDIWFIDVYVHGGGGILMINSDGTRIESSRINNVGNFASNEGDAIVAIDGSDNIVVVRNSIENAAHGAVDPTVQNDGQATMNNWIIAQNRIVNTRASNYLESGKVRSALVECNEIAYTATGTPRFTPNGVTAVLLAGKNGTFRYNIIHSNNESVGISLQAYVFSGSPQYAEGYHIHNNTIVANGGACFFFGATGVGYNRNNLIENNLCALNAGYVYEGTYNLVADFYNHDGNANRWTGSFTDGTIFRSNILQASQRPFQLVTQAAGGNVQFTTIAQMQSAYPTWTNNIGTDAPGFTNAAGKIFTLQAGSPAIDAGRAITGVAFNGTAPDIGAFEK
jgi:hypothetical protein